LTLLKEKEKKYVVRPPEEWKKIGGKWVPHKVCFNMKKGKKSGW